MGCIIRYIRKSLLLLLLCLAPAAGQLLAQETVLTVIHTNDTHSRIEPIADARQENAGMGGASRRDAYVRQVRQEQKNVLLFDCGDFSQGTPFYAFFKGQAEIQVMNAMRYDAATLGNHEFDLGLDNLKQLAEQAAFPFVCTNYDFSRTQLRKLVKPYNIIKKAGLRIGIIGIGACLEGLVQEKNYDGMKFVPPYGIAERTAHYLKTRKRCDIVICLSHLGMERETAAAYSDRELVARTRSIDLVLGGHTHTLMHQPELITNAEGRQVPVMQAGRDGAYMGRIDLKLKKK